VNKKLKLLYENAELNSDEPIFSIGEVVEIIKAGSGKTSMQKLAVAQLKLN